MKRLLIIFVILGSAFSFIEYSHAYIFPEKKVVVKNLILAKADLIKHLTNAQEYINELDMFFEKHSDDTQKLEGVLTRVQSAKTKLGTSIAYNDIRKILNYIEHLSIYTLTQTKGYTPPIDFPEWETLNTQTLVNMKTLQQNIDTRIATKNLNIQEIVGEKIQETTPTDSYFLMGYPSYGNLGIMKGGYQDSLAREYIISVLESPHGDYFQILGYLRKDKNTKVAYIIGNYTKLNQYFPESLFVDPKSGKPIMSGDEFDIQ